MNKAKLILLLLLQVTIVTSQNLDQFIFNDAYREGQQISVEFLIETTNNSERTVFDSVLAANNLESKIKLFPKDTVSHYSYDIQINEINSSERTLSISNFKLKMEMSNLDTLNSLYRSYLENMEIVVSVRNDWTVKKVKNLKMVKELGKTCKRMEQEIKDYSWRYSSGKYFSYKSIMIPSNKAEIENYINVLLSPFFSYEQDLSKKVIYPKDYQIPFSNSTIKDTLFVEMQEDPSGIVVIDNNFDISKDAISKALSEDKSALEKGFTPEQAFEYQSHSQVYIESETNHLSRFIITSRMTSGESFNESKISYIINNGG